MDGEWLPAVVEVTGLLQDPAFHVAKCAAEVPGIMPVQDGCGAITGLSEALAQVALKLKFPSKFADPVVHPLLEFAWNEYLQEKKKELRGEVWGYASHVMCFVNGWLLGDEKDLLEWAYCKWGYCDFKPEALYQAITEDFYTKHLKSSQASNVVLQEECKHMFVYLDIAIEEQPIGTLLFELFSDVCPKTCENFRALCEGGVMSPSSGQELTYKNSCFHRLVKPVWIQGGDITGKGDGGESIYGPTFEDENYAIPHKGRGVLGMANKGRHSNGSQFYITLQPVPYLDKKCVAFGQLIEGTEVLQRLETVPTHNERPRVVCKVTNCGTFQP
ncbi:probable inactive peptidyl-prolyl cis-trans isomerase-like 6 isoform X3 [Gallus gallus]|uniref:probable inactive peptidyl-prolyl cis-trans isomerase-like 6 isoform X3 n=1 Tax=Gallus gallus TaxID=9031 RepID=UPI001AE0EF19|nr:probable inactive peptidyl-prolyl cis-trans isomerase-like 6 isoform X3 [Gallus gallus]XP_040554294.1 probable inactive peptidyl-prolyl cis-trans isomerase-like 6 isoform X3 [Gallus gallus]